VFGWDDAECVGGSFVFIVWGTRFDHGPASSLIIAVADYFAFPLSKRLRHDPIFPAIATNCHQRGLADCSVDRMRGPFATWAKPQNAGRSFSPFDPRTLVNRTAMKICGPKESSPVTSCLLTRVCKRCVLGLTYPNVAKPSEPTKPRNRPAQSICFPVPSAETPCRASCDCGSVFDRIRRLHAKVVE